MKNEFARELTQEYPGITAGQYIETRLRNADFERSMHKDTDGSLLEWFSTQLTCTIRFRISVQWSEPVNRIMGSDEVEINEKRTFDEKSEKYEVKSSFRTPYKFLSASLVRNIDNTQAGCTENLRLEINYDGGSFKNQIISDFFGAISKHIFPFNHVEMVPVPINMGSNSGLFIPPKHSLVYLAMHAELNRLKEASEAYSRSLDSARLVRQPLITPNADQIGQVCTYVDKKRFSIQPEIDQMIAETERTRRLILAIKRVRQQTATSSSLPAFVIASCAAVVFLVVSRS